MAEEKLLVKRNGDFHYPIYFEEDFSNLSQVLRDEQMEGRRICVVADSNTAALYGEAVQKELSMAAAEVLMFVFSAGEMCIRDSSRIDRRRIGRSGTGT